MAISSRHKRNIHFAMSGMTDIVFLLLIFFMIASTLIVPGSQGVDLPHSNNQTVATPDVYVSLTRNLEYFIDGEAVEFSQLENQLKIILVEKQSENPTIRLNADENLDWDEIMNFVKIAKKNKYRLILGTRPI